MSRELFCCDYLYILDKLVYVATNAKDTSGKASLTVIFHL